MLQRLLAEQAGELCGPRPERSAAADDVGEFGSLGGNMFSGQELMQLLSRMSPGLGGR